MSKRWILAGSTDQTIDVFVQDSSSTTGAGLTGLTAATSGLTCYYRKGATGTPTALTLASQTVGGAHTDGGFVAVDGTNMPGVYRLDLSDTIVASAGMVTLFLRGATNMAPLPLEIEVVSVNPYDSAAFGLSRLDAAVSSRMETYTQPTGFLAATFPTSVASPTNITAGTITTVSGNVVGSVGSVTAGVVVTTNNDKTGYSLAVTPPTAGAIADAVWDEAYATHTTAGTFGKLLDTLRKANYVTEGSVDAGGTPTTTSFRTTLTAADGTFDNQTLLFLTGALAGESVPILTYQQANGLITTQEALTVAPTAADEFVILPDHVHSIAEIVSGVLTTQMTESYRATNAAPTLAQAAFELIAHMGEAEIAGTTKTLRKIDGSTTAKTYTLDSSTTPTSITETT